MFRLEIGETRPIIPHESEMKPMKVQNQLFMPWLGQAQIYQVLIDGSEVKSEVIFELRGPV